MVERDPDSDEAWRIEIERRIAELDSGAVETVPWEVVKAELLRRISASEKDIQD
jgi:putative addiction module component (TIGR02574 family)